MEVFKVEFTNSVCFQILVLNIIGLQFSAALKNKDKPCSEVSPCKCVFPTGRGVDLTLLKKDLSLRATDQGNNTFQLNLCENMPAEINSTNLCSICIFNPTLNHSINLGKVEDMKIISQSEWSLDTEPMSLLFEVNNTKTNIDLKCNSEATKPKLTFRSFVGSTYKLELESVHACLKLMASEGLSWGSLLVILFLTFTLVYFAGGMLTLKLLRGAEGREMIPNIDFWMDLPNLVRDGVLFMLNGFRPPPTYDRI